VLVSASANTAIWSATTGSVTFATNAGTATTSGFATNAGTATVAGNLSGGATLPDYLAPAVGALTMGSSVAVNAATANDFRLTLTASTATIASPSNPVDGETIKFQLTQDATGTRILTWNTVFDFGALGTATLSITPSVTDIVGFVYNAAKSKWLYLGSLLGY
jgi:hypothetical protein